MRAINLIPDDQRRGAGGAAGKSGGAAHLLLAALALIVAMTAAYVVVGKSKKDKQAELSTVTQQAVAAEARARSLADYTKFTAIRAKRVQTVTQLANSRFDWAHSLREVARVLPENAWLTDLTGTVSPSVTLSGSSSTLRGALPVPAISVQGCTTSQASVAKMMARMRLIDGVQRVSLETSEKTTAAAPTSGQPAVSDSAGTGDCRMGRGSFPKFSLVVFFEQSAVVASSTPTAATTASTSATAASSTTPASSTAPATTTTPAATPAATGGTQP